MQKREPFNLRLPLAAWSGILCLFSFFGTIAVWPEFVSLARNKGFVATYCDNSYRYDFDLMYWYTVFVLSKLAELLDTAFIVLRKQKLITLHCKRLWHCTAHCYCALVQTFNQFYFAYFAGVHHVLTLVYCFYVYRDMVSTARWMVTFDSALIMQIDWTLCLLFCLCLLGCHELCRSYSHVWVSISAAATATIATTLKTIPKTFH